MYCACHYRSACVELYMRRLFALTLCMLILMQFVFRWNTLRQMSASRVRNFRGPKYPRSVLFYIISAPLTPFVPPCLRLTFFLALLSRIAELDFCRSGTLRKN